MDSRLWTAKSSIRNQGKVIRKGDAEGDTYSGRDGLGEDYGGRNELDDGGSERKRTTSSRYQRSQHHEEAKRLGCLPRKLRPPAGRSRDGTAAAQTLAYNYPIYYAKHQLSYRRAIHTRINRIGTVCTMPWTFRIPRSNGIATRAGPRLPCPSQYTRHTVGRPGNNSSAERSSTMRHHQTNGALTATASIRY